MKIALAQINSFTGSILSNEKNIQKHIKIAEKQKVHLLIFPEMALHGYSPLDLLKRKFFLQEITQSIQRIHKEIPKDMRVLLSAAGPGYPPKNSVFLLQKNKKVKIFSKEILANYDVFDEERYFKTGKMQDNFFLLKGHLIQVLICEEIWHKPFLKHQKQPSIIISLNASPFSVQKQQERIQTARRWVKKYSCHFIYLNSVGGQEELIFDGGSFILDSSGKQIHQSPFFKEHIAYCSLPIKKKKLPSPSQNQKITSKQEQMIQALTFGLKEFVEKNNFHQVHLGLSGGVDSALTATLACKALGEKKVRLFFLPGPFTTKLSKQCALSMANKVKCPLFIQSIEEFYFHFLKVHLLKSNQGEAPDYKPTGLDITKQNIQARLRSLFLMIYANNQTDSLLLGTANKSELALGYSTLYGDLAGGLLPIGDLLKTEVYQLARYLKIPSAILKRKASAELKENQKDEDDLPPYEKLDPVLRKLIEKEQDPKTSFEKQILQWIVKTEFKRRQAPPILKVKSRSFDRGWKLPLSMKLSI